MTFEEKLEAALRSPEPFLQLRALAADYLQQGESREAVLDRFERVQTPLRAAGREADEDVVLEVMDCLVGWCSPHMKL